MARREPMTRSAGAMGARCLLATKWIDRAHVGFDLLRSELVASLASDEMLDRLNDAVYSGAEGYDPGAPGFRSYLFPWEEQVIERDFPPPPARILLGGGGSGREAFALIERGYEVVMFDPSLGLLNLMAKRISGGPPVDVYLAGYEDLPNLRPLDDGAPERTLSEFEGFDAGILGWGSFSHVRTREQRLHALRSFGEATSGPILLSFLHLGSRRGRLPLPLARLLDELRRRRGRTPGDAFSIYIGFYHVFNEPEFRELAAEAGLRIVHLSEERESWPHAVVSRR